MRTASSSCKLVAHRVRLDTTASSRWSGDVETNIPEAAILGVHSIKKCPVVMPDDSIAARQMLYLSLSFDHRIIDGAEEAGFMSYLIELLATPESLLLEG